MSVLFSLLNPKMSERTRTGVGAFFDPRLEKRISPKAMR